MRDREIEGQNRALLRAITEAEDRLAFYRLALAFNLVELQEGRQRKALLAVGRLLDVVQAAQAREVARQVDRAIRTRDKLSRSRERLACHQAGLDALNHRRAA